MIDGFLGAILWGLDTVILSLALAPFHLIFAAPAAATCIHDTISALLLNLDSLRRKDSRKTLALLKTKQGLLLICAGLLGGPIGMCGYVFSIRYAGAGLAAVFSGLYPALGLLCGRLIFHEKLGIRRIGGLLFCLAGVIFLSIQSTGTMDSPGLGLLYGLLCIVGWGLEGVVVQMADQMGDVQAVQALTIRQTTSALTFMLVLLVLPAGWPTVFQMVQSRSLWITALAALAGTLSYLFYYRAIGQIGASKAQPINMTYTAWALVFSFLLLHQSPSLNEITAACMIIGGAILCADPSGTEIPKGK